MLIVLFILVCVPPLLSLLACRRRRLRVMSRGGSGQWPTLGMALSVAVLIVNLAILASVEITVIDGVPDIRKAHAVGLSLSWMCFWVWLYVILAFRRRKRLIL
ncbi:MAG: hypothetical protein KDE08_11365 [Rhodobacteraceae bacterium]|nr:hypothetical protein [Paracoccaceae bacterium]